MSFWVRLAFSVGCVLVVLWWADAGQVLLRLRSLDAGWMAVALIALTMATFSMSHRWQCAARAFGLSLSFTTALREYYLGQFINTVLPGGVVGDMTRAVRARQSVDFSSAAQSVVAERLLGQLAMLSLMFAGFAIARVWPDDLIWNGVDLAVLVGLVLLAAVTSLSMMRNTATGRFLLRTIALMRSPAVLLHGFVTTTSLILAFYACARAAGVTIPPEGWATVIPLILCAMLIPLSVGGWGWREGAAGLLFPVFGASADAGIATSISYGIALLLSVLPAVGILFVTNFSKPASLTKGT
ncbi:lysylphosphatidylglycerol synthase transmembrane domain-containing protein [Tateyamaria sp. ANG-S1]|uniref:lysylphosphatidylglycerol synthase transmembrane domain-containing protein n=1 Tax=Tateyamaria sp. ANG-S1 TaxID=1577905 RepID=UPI001F4CF5F4|nr:lysylphosphatidylglycerol synthase transmembrane domain-containing protein [Tateyamaria sp. ANG-S1]